MNLVRIFSDLGTAAKLLLWLLGMPDLRTA
jgi:hypothetical protein